MIVADFRVSTKSDLSSNCWDSQSSGTLVGTWAPSENDYEGTSWRFDEVSITSEALEVMKSVAESYYDNTTLDKNFYPTTEQVTSYKTTVEGLTYDSEKSWTDYFKAISDAKDVVLNNVQLPAEGYYYIKNYVNNRFLADDGTDGNGCVTIESNTVDSYWKLTKTDNGYSLQNAKTGRYIATEFTYNVPMQDEVCSLTLLPAAAGVYGTAALQGQNNTATYSSILCGDANVTGWNATGGKSNWYWIAATELDPAEYTAAKNLMDGASSTDKYFCLNATGVAKLQTAYNNLVSDKTNPEYIAAMATALEGISDKSYYNMPESGRYFIQSYCTITSDGESQHPYLANHYNLMGVGKSLLSYYSIWDVTENTNDGTYTIQNEGQRFLAEPMNLSATSDAYLGYQVDESGQRTHIGCFASGTANYTLDLCPAQFGYAGYAAIQVHNAIDEKNYAAYFDMFGKNTNVGDSKDTHAITNDIMAGTLTGAEGTNNESVKQAFLWSFTKVTADEEKAMFMDQINNSLVGYAGGLASISTAAAQKESWLSDVLANISSATSRLSVSTYNSGAEQIVTDGKPTVGAAEYMQNIFKDVSNNRNGVDGVTPSDLHITLKANEHFYFENMHGSRPHTYSRMHAGTSYYQTTAQSDISDMTDYMWYTANGSTTGSYNCYTVASNGDKNYLNSSSDDLFLHPSDSNPLDFNIIEITPSMYVINDVNYAGTDGKSYITVESDYNALVHYNYIELSTLWKLKTIATTKVYLNLDPEDTESYRAKMFGSDTQTTYVKNFTNAGKYDTTNSKFLDNYGKAIEATTTEAGTTYGANNLCYATYCPAIDMMVFSDAGYKAYTVSDIANNTLTLTPVATEDQFTDTNYKVQYLNGGTGYILISEPTTEVISSFVGEIAYSDKVVAAPETNYLTGITEDLKATDHNMAVLNYVETGSEALGHAVNESNTKVYGVGIGFYNLAVGKTLDAGKAYIKLNDEKVYKNTTTATFADGTTGSVAAMKFLIEDENGEETGIAELNADGTMTVQPKAIYDLSGRRVSKAQKGIYIVNGKKVMF